MTTMLPKIVGLTGGIGSGKSEVRQILQDFGVPCIDADVVARAIHQDALHPALAELAQDFPHVMTADGRLARGSLRNTFAIDPAANRHLTERLKPYVLADLQRWAAEQTTPYVVWESALIVEADIAVDRVLTIDTRHALQITRIKARNPDWTDEQIGRVLALQISRTERAAAAHEVIANDGTLRQLQAQVHALHRAYLARWQG